MCWSRIPRLCVLFCALVALFLTGCATVASAASSGKSTTSRAALHSAVPQSTASPLTTDTAGVQNRPLPSAGCGKQAPVASGSSVVERMLSGGVERLYRIHVPRGYAPRMPIPLVLNFHGHGSYAAAQERLTGFSILADRYDFLVVYPQGSVGTDDRYGWDSGGHGRPTSNDVLFVSDLLTQVQAKYCVDPQRIYATGFSNGGGMTALLSCQLAGRVAAFAPVSGSYYPHVGGCLPGRPVSLMEFHGTADTTVPYGGRPSADLLSVPTWLSQWAQRDSCAAEPKIQAERGRVTLYTWTGCTAGAEIMHYRISGWGHHWPALPIMTTQEQEAQTSGVPVASVLIWDFFAAHPLPTAPTRPSSTANPVLAG